jgi:hypothetical protein
MYDYSFQGILNQIGSYTTFGLVYLIGAGLLFGAISGFYWGVRKAIIVGVIVVLALFLFLTFQETGLTPTFIPTFLTFFKGILYTAIGLIVGAVLAHLLFNVNR